MMTFRVILLNNKTSFSKASRFLCLLHAITSHCLPDQLTGLTGTEQALAILDSAAVKSFDQLSEANMELLASIADLTPPETTTHKDSKSCRQ